MKRTIIGLSLPALLILFNSMTMRAQASPAIDNSLDNIGQVIELSDKGEFDLANVSDGFKVTADSSKVRPEVENVETSGRMKITDVTDLTNRDEFTFFDYARDYTRDNQKIIIEVHAPEATRGKIEKFLENILYENKLKTIGIEPDEVEAFIQYSDIEGFTDPLFAFHRPIMHPETGQIAVHTMRSLRDGAEDKYAKADEVFNLDYLSQMIFEFKRFQVTKANYMAKNSTFTIGQF